MKKSIAFSLMCAAISCGFETTEDVAGQSAAIESELAPNGKGFITRNEHAARQGQPDEPGRAGRPGRPGSSNGISFHGGPVMVAPVKLYYIWYGDWANNTATTILTDLAGSFSGSRYWGINTSYYSSSNVHVSSQVTYAGSTSITNYPYGTALSDANIQSVVADAIGQGKLPADDNGVYFVLTSKDVNASSGFCTQYCGWHTAAGIGGKNIKYAFVGNPERCPSACAAQTTSPNGNAGADGMASIIAHEASEAVTDPNLNAWYDSRGNENADKCAWNFGSMQTLSNGAKYNVVLGSRKYLIQQNWVNASGGYCALSF